MSAIQRQRLLLIAAGLCIAALAGDSLIVEPLIATWKARSQRIDDLNSKLTKGQMLLERATTLHEREHDMRAMSLPANKTEAENKLLAALGEWASASRLGVTGLRPHWVVDDELGSRLEIQISAKGDLDRIGHFMHALESDTLPLRVETLELRSRDDKGGDIALETQVSSIILAEGKP